MSRRACPLVQMKGASQRACLLVPTVVIAALIASSGAIAGPGRRLDCLPPHATTLAKDREILVYSLASPTLNQGGTYACRLGRKTKVTLAKPSRYCCHSIEHVTVVGAIVAYTEGTRGVDSGCAGIVVVDVAHRRTLLTVPDVACYVDAGIISFSRLTDFVLSPHGSAAWIVQVGGVRQTAGFEVHSAQVSGVLTLLDQDPTIVPGSMRLSHGLVSWEDAGRRSSAPLS